MARIFDCVIKYLVQICPYVVFHDLWVVHVGVYPVRQENIY